MILCHENKEIKFFLIQIKPKQPYGQLQHVVYTYLHAPPTHTDTSRIWQGNVFT